MSYDVGDRPRWRFEFKDYAGALADPALVRVVVREPATSSATPAVETEYVFGTDSEVEKVSTGVYRFSAPFTKAGTWTIFFQGMHGPTPEETIVSHVIRPIVRSPQVTAVFPT